MNEAKHLTELKMLHQICAEQINIILTAETKAEKDSAEEYYTSAFHCIIKLIKKESEKETNHTTSHQYSKAEMAQNKITCFS